MINAPMKDLDAAELGRFQNANGKAIEAIRKGLPGEAIRHLEEALSICEHAAVLSNYGDALARAGRIAEAKRAFCRAIELAPDWEQGHYNLGVVLMNADDYDAAREAFARSIECRVTAIALNNLGNMETYTLRLADAERHYRAAVKHGYADARWNLSLCLMMQGKWSEGWDLYEHRPQMVSMANEPRIWRGEDVAGKTIIVATEQGLGDSIFAIRYMQELRRRGARVIVACESTLRRLIEQALPPDGDLPAAHVIERSQPVNEPFDFVTLAMSIPGYVTPDGILPGAKYLSAVGAPMPSETFNVGICWNGSTEVGPPKFRNIPLAQLKPLADIEGVRLVSLQRGGAEAEIEDCGFEVADAMASAKDVYDTACVIESLDLVITVDTLIPHLAAALGKPVWLMNRYMSCWQWGTPEYDPVLYANVNQFRQARPLEWAPVVEHVAYGLKHVMKARARVEEATV